MIRSAARGHTLLEAAVVIAVFSAALTAAFGVLDRGAHFSERAVHAAVATQGVHHALEGFLDVLEESSPELIDTTSRAGSFGATSFASDRFFSYGQNLSQCRNPMCRFHTRPDFTRFEPRYFAGFEFRSGAGTSPLVLGKVLPSSIRECPFDGGPTYPGANLDGVKAFVARGSDGAFATAGGASPKPAWNGIVFFFPYAETNKLPELRRYEVHVADLLTTAPLYTPGWSAFDPLHPSMIDLFDFGTDGTTNGLRDQRVPVTAAGSDASSETFLLGTNYGEPAIIVTKTLNNFGVYPWRSLSLTIRLRDGATSFSVTHFDTAAMFWTATRNFTRAPRTIVSDLSEFAASTAASNPFDPTTNPTGIADPGVVRITVGTSSVSRAKAEPEWTHEIDSFVLKPRN